jgi:hypothetical protein
MATLLKPQRTRRDSAKGRKENPGWVDRLGTLENLQSTIVNLKSSLTGRANERLLVLPYRRW